jgi:hypothetical protein
MRGRSNDRLVIPAACWSTAEMLTALAARDIGFVFRTAQRHTGASQTLIGVATGLSQAQVSEIMGRKRQVATIDVIARIVIGLDIPEPARTVLLLGDRKYADGAPAPLAEAPAPLPVPAPRPEPADEPGEYGDVTAVYATRSEFMSRMPPHALLDDVKDVRAAGLSLNLICQHYADNRLIDLLNRGATLRLAFLDPDGEAIRTREREEGYTPGHLTALTDLNIQNMLRRVRDRLEPEARGNLQIGVYDETIRFNILLLDASLCIAQPYMPEVRGVDSPTFVMRPRTGSDGLFATFTSLFDRLWQHAQLR